jgi:prepilin-type N-terminal cleavage/methylation domain-containing protein
MNQRGMTLIEIVIVIVLIGAMAGYAIPRIGDAITKQNVRSARTLFVSMHARARATAIQRGSRTQLVVSNGQLRIVSFNPVTGASESVGNLEDLGQRYGVTVSPSTLTLTFDPRGIGTEASQTEVTIRKGSYTSRIVISPAGRVIQ